MADLGPDDLFFFGVWNTPQEIEENRTNLGHYWFKPGGTWAPSGGAVRLVAHAFDWIDGGYAPREWRGDRIVHRKLVENPACCYVTEPKHPDDRRRVLWDTNEMAQGMFLVHHKRVLPANEVWSLMSWWDRSQGDARAACNSNIVARGQLTCDELFDLLREHFGHVVKNIANAGIVLRECGAIPA